MRKRSTRTRRRVSHRSTRRNPALRKFYKMTVNVLVVVGIAFIAWHVVGKLARPYIVGYAEGQEISQIRSEIAQVEADNKALKSEIRYLSTPAGAEAEARKLGMVKDGEVALIVEPPKKSAESGSASQMDHRPFWQRAGTGIAHFFGGRHQPK